MFKIFTKDIAVPESNDVKTAEAVQLWRVDWISRYGEFSADTRKETEWFTSDKAANDFAASLRSAFKLIKHTHGNGVSVRKEA